MDRELKQRARRATQKAVVDAAQKYHPVQPRGIDWRFHKPFNTYLGHREQIRRRSQRAKWEWNDAGKRGSGEGASQRSKWAALSGKRDVVRSEASR